MTRSISCDVCDKADDISQADLYFVLQIPHVNLEGDEPITEDPLIVDVCSVECMHTVVDSLDRDRVPVSPDSASERIETTTLEDMEQTFETVPGPNGTFVPIPVANYRPEASRIGGGMVNPDEILRRPRNRLQADDLDDVYSPGPHVSFEGEVTVDGKRPRPS